MRFGRPRASRVRYDKRRLDRRVRQIADVWEQVEQAIVDIDTAERAIRWYVDLVEALHDPSSCSLEDERCAAHDRSWPCPHQVAAANLVAVGRLAPAPASSPTTVN